MLTIRRRQEREAALQFKAEADRRTREEQQLEQQQRQTDFIAQKTRRLVRGDARDAMAKQRIQAIATLFAQAILRLRKSRYDRPQLVKAPQTGLTEGQTRANPE